ncbi:MAG: KH domain-containing protein [Verrucomicrobia bacterium]|nr:KH domain-containing protein [Verrucomicrobiota bacterium]
MQDFIAYLIKNLVDQPDAVQVQLVEGQQGTVVEVRVSSDDVAKVVGKQGRTIKSLRTIAMTVGARFGRRVRLELVS